jgi:leader peptidase (prepilin peptidase) / N-methyltransferase
VSLPALFLLAAGGLMVGSFLNVCIARIPAGQSVVSPASRCPSCRVPIRWFDNIPVLSYVLLGGRCRSCRAPIGWRYPLVELVTAGAFVLQGVITGPDPVLLTNRLVLTALLIVLFGTDFDTQRLPNVLTIPGIALGIAFSVLGPPGVFESAAGAALGGGILLAVRWGWKRATGVDGMGLGDVKMLAMIGAFLGWRHVWIVLFFASLAGAVVGVLLTLVQKRSLQSRLPFGTFLALAAYASSLFGERLLDWYLNLY